MTVHVRDPGSDDFYAWTYSLAFVVSCEFAIYAFADHPRAEPA